MCCPAYAHGAGTMQNKTTRYKVKNRMGGMSFTTPCFVLVKDPEKQNELIEWLRNIRYNVNKLDDLDINPVFAASSKGIAYSACNFYDVPGFIDCGDNIEMFKALAAMNDENDREQWFVEEGRMFKCTSDKINNYSYHWITTRKATAQEIVEYFKNI